MLFCTLQASMPLIVSTARTQIARHMNKKSCVDYRGTPWELTCIAALWTQYRHAPATPVWPTRAYVVTSDHHVRSGRAKHALDELAKLNITEVRYIYGPDFVDDQDIGCDRGATQKSCRMGLAWGHQMAWKHIAQEKLLSALVIEDDILVHDLIDQLLPLYWSQVPADFEIVMLGHFAPWIWDSVYNPPKHLVTYGPYTPQAAHAYILNHVSARRLDHQFEEMVWQKGRPDVVPTDFKPQLTSWHIVPDLFLIFQAMPQAKDKSKWVFFESTEKYPGRWQGAEFLTTHKMNMVGDEPCDCNDDPTEGKCSLFLPIDCQGLVYQHHHCSNMTRLRMWVEQYKRNAPATAFPLDTYPLPSPKPWVGPH